MANQKKTFMSVLLNGLIWENPTFVLMLGMCPTLAITTSGMNGIGMGLAVTVILICSNILISALRKVIPNQIRIAAYITIIAGFVTVVDLSIQAFLPALSQSLGVFIPLIVVNCIILGRAEAFASKNNVLDSAMDGLGSGLGFTLSLTVIGAVREMLGSGAIFGMKFIHGDGMLLFILAPGAFIVLGYLLVLFNKLTAKLK